MSYRVIYPKFRDDVAPIVVHSGVHKSFLPSTVAIITEWFDGETISKIEDDVDMEFDTAVMMYLNSVLSGQVNDFLEITLEIGSINPWS